MSVNANNRHLIICRSMVNAPLDTRSSNPGAIAVRWTDLEPFHQSCNLNELQVQEARLSFKVISGRRN